MSIKQHFLEQIEFEPKVEKREDMDITTYLEKNEEGETISKYKIYEIYKIRMGKNRNIFYILLSLK